MNCTRLDGTFQLLRDRLRPEVAAVVGRLVEFGQRRRGNRWVHYEDAKKDLGRVCHSSSEFESAIAEYMRGVRL